VALLFLAGSLFTSGYKEHPNKKATAMHPRAILNEYLSSLRADMLILRFISYPAGIKILYANWSL
jgi:hypothetical protein